MLKGATFTVPVTYMANVVAQAEGGPIIECLFAGRSYETRAAEIDP